MGIPRLLDRCGNACRICQGAGRSHSKGVPLWSPSRPHKTLGFTLALVWSPSRPHKTLGFTLALVWSPSRPHKTLEFTLALVWSPSRPRNTLGFTLVLVWTSSGTSGISAISSQHFEVHPCFSMEGYCGRTGEFT